MPINSLIVVKIFYKCSSKIENDNIKMLST